MKGALAKIKKAKSIAKKQSEDDQGSNLLIIANNF